MRSCPGSAALALAFLAGIATAAMGGAAAEAQYVAPAGAPPGAGPQTMPSTLSPENAAADRRSWEERQLELTDAQKQTIRSSISSGTSAAAAGEGGAGAQTAIGTNLPGASAMPAKVGTVLASSVVMHDLPRDATEQVPVARGFKYVRTETQLLLVDPASWMVVVVLE